MMKKLNILLVDDYRIVRDGLKAIIKVKYPDAIIYEADDGLEAIDILESNIIHLMITDLNMPKMGGIELTKKASKLFPTLKIMIFSMYNDEIVVKEAVNAGAIGFISKTLNNDVELINGIDRTLLNIQSYDKGTQKNILSGMFISKHEKLTKNEYEIISYISEGLSIQEISETMSISESTVESHRTNILKKLNIQTDTEIKKYAYKNEISTLSSLKLWD